MWGALNSGIALAGLFGPEPAKHNLKNLLYINDGIDMGYLAAGTALLFQPDAKAQGVFLFLFDLLNDLALESP